MSDEEAKSMNADLYKAAKKAFTAFCSIALVGFSLTYALMVRDYHKALEKHQALTDLLNNPNVRVASGEKAKLVLSELE